jgi:ABC-type lipoprotein export system ATPase subunit
MARAIAIARLLGYIANKGDRVSPSQTCDISAIDINLTFVAGSFVGIVGQSGSGRSL